MKKIILLVLAAFASATIFAQNNQPQLRTSMAVKTRFGLRAGVNLADLRAKDLPSAASFTEAKEKTFFNGGAFVNIPIGSMFRFQPEVNYSMEGGRVQGPSAGSTQTMYTQVLQYINIPVGFQWMDKKGFLIETGPQVGFLIAAKRKDISGMVPAVMASDDNKGNFDRIDFAWGAGLGYLSRIGLGLDARFNYGIANIMEDNPSSTEYMKGTWKNSVGQVSLIYQFGANK